MYKVRTSNNLTLHYDIITNKDIDNYDIVTNNDFHNCVQDNIITNNDIDNCVQGNASSQGMPSASVPLPQ